MNYCSLAEAYNVPSFSKKQRNTSPLTSQTQCAGSGPLSAPPPPTPAPRGAQGAPAPPPPPIAMAFDPNPEQTMFSVEGFACSGAGSVPPDPAANNIPYTTQANDYDYYCRAFGICPTPAMKITEHFDTDPTYGKSGSIAPRGFGSTTGTPAANLNSSCPLQTPVYTLPLTDAQKTQGDAAMKLFTVEVSGTNPTPPLPMRHINMTGVQGVYDEEIDQYMSVADMNAAPMPVPPKPGPGPTPAPAAFGAANKTPFTAAAAEFTPSKGGRPVLHYETWTGGASNTWQYVIDLVLFIVSGLLIIVLCDQLFKIALSIGMRDTFVMMEPYLAEISQMRARLEELATQANAAAAQAASRA